MVLVTGNGSSMAFHYPSTTFITNSLDLAIRSKYGPHLPNLVVILDVITRNLKNYLIKPGQVSFEDVFQGIEDFRTLADLPSLEAFDEYRPRVVATHKLIDELAGFKAIDAIMAEYVYLSELLEICLDSLRLVRGIQDLNHAVRRLNKDFTIWSFTLNYDDILDSAMSGVETGFEQGGAPRPFNPLRLRTAIERHQPVHCHLHGSLRWGRLLPPQEVSEIHEFDTADDGVRASRSSGSRDYGQDGQGRPKSTIITGLEKPESLQRQPFFSIFNAFCQAMDTCTDLLIGGYGFADKHVNMAIEQCRSHRRDVRTYLVSYKESGDPYEYFIPNTAPYDTLVPGHPLNGSKVKSFPNWWRVEGASITHLTTGPIFIWLNGFEAFCQEVSKKGLPS